jgi:uncharacterized protein
MTEPTPDPAVRNDPARGPEIRQLAAEAFDLARQGDATALADRIDAGVPVDVTNDRGDTLLMLAAYHSHADAVRVLLERGAQPDGDSDRGQTPLAGAVFKEAQDVIDALLEAGADPAAGAPSAIDTARMFGKQELLRRFGVG